MKKISILIVLIVLYVAVAAAQQEMRSGAKGSKVPQPITSTQIDANTNALDVNIVGGGGSGGTASSFGSAFPATGTAAGFKDTSNNMAPGLLDASGFLKINCATGCGSSSFADNSAFTAGTSSITNFGGVFNDGLAAVTSGNAAAPRITNNRALHVNIRNASGTELGTSANPFRTDPTGTTTQPVSGTVTANAGTGTFTVSDQHSNITTDYDTGAGTQTMTMYGIALPASGGSVAGGTSTNPVRTDPTGTTTQPVSGTVTANQGGTWTVQPGNTANTTPWLVSVSNTPVVAVAAACNNYKPINITASAQIITGTASKKTYICSINIVVSAADNVALVEGTGTTCATGIAGMAGGTTAATGWNLAANSGIAFGNGLQPVAATATAANNVCLLVSSAAQVSGVISWTQF